jgi:hypothetical protein
LCAPLAAWAGRRGTAGRRRRRGERDRAAWPGSSRPPSCGCTVSRRRTRRGAGARRAVGS